MVYIKKDNQMMKIISDNGLFEIICADIIKKNKDILLSVNMEKIAKNIIEKEKSEKCIIYYAYDENILTIHRNKFYGNSQKIPEQAQLKCIIVEENKNGQIEIHKFFDFDGKIYYNDLVCDSDNLCYGWSCTLYNFL